MYSIRKHHRFRMQALFDMRGCFFLINEKLAHNSDEYYFISVVRANLNMWFSNLDFLRTPFSIFALENAFSNEQVRPVMD